ncbi:hypothetical protein J7E68_01620 [Microbacterium sp. ISL-103]|uniref:hypothetical protein n=1 Tax=Microbacterium sp. ISL-103 TaxID=2819156 RepID=UPI001BEA3969|nr:hypothetical protein [Microbacterium sp. ISL-103]MBT2473306.1 hypothetical protein [Microbacterium sp. ISL-103]
MLDLTMPKLAPFLPTLTAAQTTKVTAWLPVLALRLNARYGDRITTVPSGTDPVVPANEPAFISAAADSIMTRLARPGLVDSQAVGPANVRYNSRAALLKWFLPEQLDELDAIAGLGNVRSIRMAAPDPIRFGNRMSYFDQLDEEAL